MTFATPILAAIVAAVAVPALIILYFLKLRRRDVEVSTTLLWKKAIQDLQANAPFQKLRRNILLFLQLIALTAALLALAQPEFRDTGKTASRHIILIDRSASMSASDGGEASGATISRLEAAKQAAVRLVEGLRELGFFEERGEEAMVVAFDASAEVRQNFTASKAALRAAIEGITQTDAPSSLERAYEVATAYTGVKAFESQVQEGVGFVPTAPPAVVHLFSDGRLPDAAKVQTGPEDRVVYHAVGTSEAVNIGITGVRAERAFDRPQRVGVFVGLQSTSREARTIDVELSIDGVTSRIDSVRVEPAKDADGGQPAAVETPLTPGTGGFVLPLERPEGGIATVRISPGGADALEADNVAYVVIPPAKRLAVCVVTTGNLFLRSALEGMSLSKLEVLSMAQYQELLDAGKTASYDVVIFDRELPQVKAAVGGAGQPGGGRGPGLPPGRSLVLGAVPPPPLGVIDRGEGERAFIADWDRDHPALRLAALDRVYIGKTRAVEVPENAPVRVLARDERGPAILEIQDSATRAIVVCFDPADTDWPFDPGWVLFVAGSVLSLSDINAGAAGEMVQPGSTLSTRLPAGATDVRLTLPDNSRVELEPAADGSVAFGPVQQRGVYTVTWDGPSLATDVVVDGRSRRPIAANLADPAESDLGTRATLPLAREVVTALGEADVQLTRKLWPYLVLACLAVVLFEWYVYNRKVSL